MRIGYAKLGRAIALDPARWGVVGGDMEAPRLLDTLARTRPEDTFLVLSMCPDDDPTRFGYPDNVKNTWTPERREWLRQRQKEIPTPREHTDITRFSEQVDALMLPIADKLDAIVIWAGQHGTANSILPAVTTGRSTIEGVTRPYDSFALYAGSLLRLINHWRDVDPLNREEIWLIADPRNYLKARDIKWPHRHPVLGQFEFDRTDQHERFGDARDPAGSSWEVDTKAAWKTDHTWSSVDHYVYSQLEVCSLLPQYHPEIAGFVQTNDEHARRADFGVFVNEHRRTGKYDRLHVLEEWVLPLRPVFIHGKWTDRSRTELEALGVRPTVLPFDEYWTKLKSVRCTLAMPASSSGWATTKAWEAFAAGTMCFFHPAYDTQEHILRHASPELKLWLRVSTPGDLAARVQFLSQPDNEIAWRALVAEQRALFDRAVEERLWVRLIEERLDA